MNNPEAQQAIGVGSEQVGVDRIVGFLGRRLPVLGSLALAVILGLAAPNKVGAWETFGELDPDCPIQEVITIVDRPPEPGDDPRVIGYRDFLAELLDCRNNSYGLRGSTTVYISPDPDSVREVESSS